MLYMSGGGVQIFSMGIVFMLLFTPFKNLAAMNNGTCSYFPILGATHTQFDLVFAPFAPSSSSSTSKSLSTLPLQKVVYLLCNMLTLAVGLWKCRSMGLLPTGTGDWLAFETRNPVSILPCGSPSREADENLLFESSLRRLRFNEINDEINV